MAQSSTGLSTLVTGASGFLGSHLARALASDGHDVHIVVRAGSVLADDLLERTTVHAYGGNVKSLIAILEQARPTIVFHLASLFLAQHRADQIRDLVNANLEFGMQLLEAMSANGARMLVNAGTSWQHKDGADYRPVNLYAATKQAYQDIIDYFIDADGFSAVTLQLFDSYGPGDTRQKLPKLLAEAARTGQLLRMSPGEQLIDLVHVSDIVSAFRCAADRLLAGKVSGHEVFGVSSGAPVTVRDLVALVEEACARPINVEWGALPYRPREVMAPWVPTKQLPGWKQETCLRDGLRQLFAGT